MIEIIANIFKDGTSRNERMPAALDHGYIPVDDRSDRELLRFAKEFATKLRFVDNDDKWNGADWSSFFDGDIDEMVDFINNPAKYANNQDKMDRLSRPHLALFFTFLKLLHYPQAQFRELSKRYIDFYYKDVLKIQKRAPLPDRVNVVFELKPGVYERLIKKGTLLNAGKDSLGNILSYAVDRDLVLNRAYISDIKTLFAGKRYIGLKSIHEKYNKTDQGFEKMICWALGSPDQGNNLPKYPNNSTNGQEVDLLFLQNLNKKIKGKEENDIDAGDRQYILNQLGFASIDDFAYCINTQKRQIDAQKRNRSINLPDEEEWAKAYDYINTAFRKRITLLRRNTLRDIFLDTANSDKNETFTRMMLFALGDPAPYDPLPVDMPDGLNTPDDFFKGLSGQAARQYVNESLYMSVDDFHAIMNVKNECIENPLAKDWDEVYLLLEKAQTRKRNFTFPHVGREEAGNIYADSLLEAKKANEKPPRFKAFGRELTGTMGADTPGFAVASPLFLLNEGSRVITITIECEKGSFDQEKANNVLNEKEKRPFDVLLSSAGKLINPVSVDIQCGNYVVEKEEAVFQQAAPVNKQSNILTTETIKFKEEDVNGYISTDQGELYRIDKLISENEALLTYTGKVDTVDAQKGLYKKFNQSSIYLNSLQFRITLDENVPAIRHCSPEISGINTQWPVVKIMLKCFRTKINLSGYATHYDIFKRIRINKARIVIEASNLRELVLRNDTALINPKSPFEPFGNAPVSGSGFYFANPEICLKKLDRLSINPQWKGLPGNFGEYYEAYTQSGLVGAGDISKESFAASIKMFNNRCWNDVEPGLRLFEPTLKALKFDVHNYTALPSSPDLNSNDPFDMQRYFKLELGDQDFLHNIYPMALNKCAQVSAKELSTIQLTPEETALKGLQVYPPFTPKINGFSVDYSASADIDLMKDMNVGEEECIRDDIRLYRVDAFGCGDLILGNDRDSGADKDAVIKSNYMLPQHNDEGNIFIGIRDVKPRQEVSILFQFVAGSGVAELKLPELSWMYLSENGWRDFEKIHIISDTTNGFVDSGIIRFEIPHDISFSNMLMPVDRMWIKASSARNSEAFPDLVDVRTQAATAVFKDNNNALDHLEKPLASGSIKKTVTKDADIQNIFQPYSSFNGRMREDAASYYIRAGERLRHKQRAVTSWDYERMVLDRFPEIYKVKCLGGSFVNDVHDIKDIDSDICAGANDNANVTIVVIPDISHRTPFYPLEPKAHANLLKRIEMFLKESTSPFINIAIKNPNYEQVKYRIGARFKKGYEDGYYLNELNDDLKRFLSPWAYGGQNGIVFGGCIHNSKVIHFLEKRPYIDYIANLKLIKQNLSNSKAQSYANIDDSNVAYVQRPDSILVSAEAHIIDVISTEFYNEEEFEGIGYMIIGEDFEIGKGKPIFDSVGFMTIGSDFKVR